MPRYAPEETLQYRGRVIEPGVSENECNLDGKKATVLHADISPFQTRVMQSHYLHHTNAQIFPEPDRFHPERWLQDSQLKTKYFMGFGRGTRICLGMNLVYAELYLCVARILTRFDMELYETSRARDVDVKRDCIIGLPDVESRGIRARIVHDRLRTER